MEQCECSCGCKSVGPFVTVKCARADEHKCDEKPQRNCIRCAVVNIWAIADMDLFDSVMRCLMISRAAESLAMQLIAREESVALSRGETTH